MNQLSSECERSRVRDVSDRVTITSPAIDRNFCGLSAVAFLVALVVLFVPTGVFAQDGDPLAHYKVLAWNDLVAEGWKRPLLLSEGEISSPRIDPSSVVRAFEKKLVAIPGYIRPAVKEGQPLLAHEYDHDHEHLSAGTRVTEFVLVRFLPQEPYAHALWDPNQVVYVNLLKPLLVEDPESPVWVIGTITLDKIMTDDGLSAYRIVDAVTTNYDY